MKAFYSFAFILSLCFIVSCSKSYLDTLNESASQEASSTYVNPPELSSASMASMSNSLVSSSAVQNYIQATKSVESLIDVSKLTRASINQAIAISNSANFDSTALNQVLTLLKINKTIYNQKLFQQATIIKNYQQANNLTNQQTKEIWESAVQQYIDNNPTSFYAQQPTTTACQVSAYATFTITSTGCIALGFVPIVGEVLVIPCTTAAIAQLTSSLFICSGGPA